MKLKYIFGFAVVTLTLMFAAACGESGPKADGASVFKTHCQLCHGPDGRLGLNGAKDFTTSPLTEDERVQVITRSNCKDPLLTSFTLFSFSSGPRTVKTMEENFTTSSYLRPRIRVTVKALPGELHPSSSTLEP